MGGKREQVNDNEEGFWLIKEISNCRLLISDFENREQNKENRFFLFNTKINKHEIRYTGFWSASR